MNAPVITFKTILGEYGIPNRWERLTPDVYLHLVQWIHWYATGKISIREVQIAYVCYYMGLDVDKVRNTSAFENLYLIASNIDFIFSPEGKLNCCFLKQLVPEISFPWGNRQIACKGYSIDTTFGTLTSSLTAIQFVEAFELMDCEKQQLPLLAAILYLPEKVYTSEKAHAFARKLKNVDEDVLQAIALNFRSFANYLFTKTPFSLLYMGKGKKTPAISIGMAESIYSLSADGLGNAETIERLPVLKYLTILRKKMIESIRAMSASKMDVAEIAEKTGLSIQIISKIV